MSKTLFFDGGAPFPNATLEDSIRQSIIDLSGKPVPAESLSTVFRSGIEVLASRVPRSTYRSLTYLLCQIYLKADDSRALHKVLQRRSPSLPLVDIAVRISILARDRSLPAPSLPASFALSERYSEILKAIQGHGGSVTVYRASYERLRVHKLFLRLLQLVAVVDNDARVFVPIFRSQTGHRAERHLARLKQVLDRAHLSHLMVAATLVSPPDKGPASIATVLRAKQENLTIDRFNVTEWIRAFTPDQIPIELWDYLRRYDFVLPAEFAEKIPKTDHPIPSYLILVLEDPAKFFPSEAEQERQFQTAPKYARDFARILRCFPRHKYVQGTEFWVRYASAADFQTSFSADFLSRRKKPSMLLDVFARANGCPGAWALVRDLAPDLLKSATSVGKMLESCRTLHPDFVELLGPYLGDHIRPKLSDIKDLRLLQCFAHKIWKGMAPGPNIPAIDLERCEDSDYGEVLVFFKYQNEDDPFGYGCDIQGNARAIVAKAALFAAALSLGIELHYDRRRLDSVEAFVFFVVVFHIIDRIGKVAALQSAEGFLRDHIDVMGRLGTSPNLSLNLQRIIDRGLELADHNRHAFFSDPEQGRFVVFIIASLGRGGYGRGRAYEKSFMRLALGVFIDLRSGRSGDRMMRQEFHRMDILREDPTQLLEFLYANAGSLEPDFPKLDLSLLGDGNSVMRQFLERKAPNGELSWEVIQLVTKRCVNVGQLMFKNPEIAIALLDARLGREADVEVLLEFIDNFGLTKLLIPFFGRTDIPPPVRSVILSLLWSKHADEFRGKLQVDSIIDLIMNWPPNGRNLSAFFASVLLMDENARVDHYRLLIEKSIHSRIIGADVVLASFEAKLGPHSQELCRAIHCTYLLGMPKTLMLRASRVIVRLLRPLLLPLFVAGRLQLV
jgi:hypothetical protein